MFHLKVSIFGLIAVSLASSQDFTVVISTDDSSRSLDRGYETCPAPETLVLDYVKNACQSQPPNMRMTVSTGGVSCGTFVCGDLQEGTTSNPEPEPVENSDPQQNTGGSESVPSDQKYCAYNEQHTMCLFSGPSSTECGTGIIFREFTAAGQKAILDKHNELRSKAAQGVEQAPAANMQKLTWNSKLAAIAQRWVDQCTFGHDENRNLLDGTYVGQNAYTSSSTRSSGEAEINSVSGGAAEAWYNEVKNPGFSDSDISPFVFSYGAGHYTQVVWAETTEVGCGYTYYKDGRWYKTLIACNYAVGGNMQRNTMYIKGSACSQCPAGTSCDSEFTGLCALI